eukprot:CAMPEP_0179174708 /NCGR_PEP_ID=MMETSP0796-20121207/86263_1 /TAXON_ID=73915 /ORGANISM="Pyrodinium bahamense, Strain pbaha01" /LENGTH=571 /DNA_ID=CAMNT_0020878015 /DNA_START=19 /DNA_END=1734 /DNA_ORIENTATION=-
MKIELEAVPMAIGFSIGAFFFIAQRLTLRWAPPPSPPREPEEVDDGEVMDDEAWMAAHGLSLDDLPVAGPEDTSLSTKAAALLAEEEEAAASAEAEPGAEPGPEPGLVLRLWPWSPSANMGPADEAPGAAFAASGAGAAVRQEGKANAITLTLTRHNTPTEVINGIMYHRSAYWGTVLVGNPAVPFRVVFDTGSGHLILPSTYCKSAVCRTRQRYRSTTSETARNINHDGTEVRPHDMRDVITVNFGTGEVSGVFMEDRLCLHDQGLATNSDQAPARQASGSEGYPQGCMLMRLVAATSMSDEPFTEFSFDGVLGLGLAGLSETPRFNFLTVLAGTSSSLTSRYAQAFALFLAEDDDGEEESEITLGGYDDERLDGELAWNEVVEPQLGQWMVAVKSLRVGNARVAFCEGGCRAIMDTGTSMLTVPRDIFTELYELLNHPSANGQDCHGPGPKLHFDMDGITVTLEPRDYAHFESQQVSITERVSGANGTVTNETNQEEERILTEASCKAMLMTMDLPKPLGPKLFIMGEPVLRKYYTVYDSKAPPRIGLAPVRRKRWSPERRRQELGFSN